MDYVTLTDADKLMIARDVLRGRESDHFRLSLLDEPNREARMVDMEQTIGRLKGEITQMEAKRPEEPDEPPAEGGPRP